MALCPVCKFDCAGHDYCPVCGFEQKDYAFVSKEDAEQWFYQIVIPWREWCSSSRNDFIIEGTTLKKYIGDKPIVNIPDFITKVGNDCFKKTNIFSVYIPESVIEIGPFAFAWCEKLQMVHIENVQILDPLAFYRSENIKSVHLGENIKTVPFFSDGISIENISVDSQNKNFHVKNNCLIHDTTLVMGCQDCKIPDYVTEIGSEAFSGARHYCSNIVIPPNVSIIRMAAFSSIALEIVIPATVTQVERGAINACDYARIYCDFDDKPDGWDDGWCVRYRTKDYKNGIDPKVYWKNEWHYENGKPIPNE